MTAVDAKLRSKTQVLAWQGWRLAISDSWNPVKVDGDYNEGSLLLADLHSPRLGLRWKRASKRGDPAAWANRSLRDEVGQLAAAEAADYKMPGAGDWAVSRLYIDRDPPGRDVWVGHSKSSNRVLQVVHHAERRGTAFSDTLLPSLTDTPADEAKHWSIFDLSLITPPGLSVQWYRFNAGDLSLGLADAKKKITIVRQVGPAALALARQSLLGWLTQQQEQTRKLYRPIQNGEPTTLDLADRTIDGLSGILHRKRRLWWAWMVAARQTMLAFHDPLRDRLLIGQSQNESAMRDVLKTVGWARPAEAS
ncbi:MAG: hypothetical protein JWM57_376 [Phycisphaerales bacterium]|nr:hypothetical protein [Phycisphaerales bacterium]